MLNENEYSFVPLLVGVGHFLTKNFQEIAHNSVSLFACLFSIFFPSAIHCLYY